MSKRWRKGPEINFPGHGMGGFYHSSIIKLKPVLSTEISHYVRRQSLDSRVQPHYIFLAFLHLWIDRTFKFLQWDAISHDIPCKTIWMF